METPKQQRFIIKSYSKKELAEVYTWNEKTLRRKLLRYEYTIPKGGLLAPIEVRKTVEILGEPYSYFEE